MDEPKCCGNCFYSVPRKYGHWATNNLICLKHVASTNSERSHVTEYGFGINGPRGWRPKEDQSHSWENKYKKLKKITDEMLNEIQLMTKGMYKHYSPEDITGYYEEKLKEVYHL